MTAHTGIATNLSTWLTAQPSVQYRRNLRFYFLYDARTCWPSSPSTPGSSPRGQGPLVQVAVVVPGLLPPVIYVHILLNVFIHNCCHGNFLRRSTA